MMHMEARLEVAALLALAAGSSVASDWQVAAGSEAGIYEVDLASLVRVGPVVRAWVRIVLTEPTDGPGGIKVMAARSRQYFDCADRRWAHKQSTFYADQQFQKVLRDGEDVPDALLDWNEVPPDSGTELLLEFACSHAPAE